MVAWTASGGTLTSDFWGEDEIWGSAVATLVGTILNSESDVRRLLNRRLEYAGMQNATCLQEEEGLLVTQYWHRHPEHTPKLCIHAITVPKEVPSRCMYCQQPSHPGVFCNAVSKQSTQNCDSLTEGAEGVDGKVYAWQNLTHPPGISESENHRRELERPIVMVKRKDEAKSKFVVR